MDGPLQTPVTISCDNPSCPEVDLTIALAVDNTGDLADVRRRALNAAVDEATAKGWSVHFIYGPPPADAFIASAYCPLHCAAKAWML